VRELDFDHAEARLHEDGPVLTITYRLRAGLDVPPEVSGPGSQRPLLVRKADAAGDSIELSFEDVGPVADGYDVYAGDIGAWYTHAGSTCGTAPPASEGRRAIVLAVPEPARYVLVTAANPCAEGTSGADSTGRSHPVALLDCLP
jgi:hypothetical protein